MIWAAQHGLLPGWLDQGVAIVDRQDHLGGSLGRYSINSDSLGGSYLEFLDAAALSQDLRCLRDDPVAHEMARYRDGFPPLPLVDRFMRRVGGAIEAMIADWPRCAFHRRTEARALQLRLDGLVTVETVLGDGSHRLLTARSAIVALGGRQRSTEQALMPGLSLSDCRPHRVMSSDDLLSPSGLDEAGRAMATAGRRRIVILGGSHSAYVAAWALLRLPPAARLAAGQILILQRRPPRVFYASRETAEADLYPVADGDICPRTGRVNRLGGLRGNGRDVWRQLERRPYTQPEPRIAALPLQQFTAAGLRRVIEQAALIVPAFGYRAAMLPIFDTQGQRLALSADSGGAAVGDDCRLLLAGGQPLPNVFGIGLGSGYRPTGSMGGEPNFDGQANSLWLYQNDIGAVIFKEIQDLLGDSTTAISGLSALDHPASFAETGTGARSPNDHSSVRQ